MLLVEYTINTLLYNFSIYLLFKEYINLCLITILGSRMHYPIFYNLHTRNGNGIYSISHLGHTVPLWYCLAFGKLTDPEWNSFIILYCAFVCVLKESYGAIYFALEAGENASSCCTIRERDVWGEKRSKLSSSGVIKPLALCVCVCVCHHVKAPANRWDVGVELVVGQLLIYGCGWY